MPEGSNTLSKESGRDPDEDRSKKEATLVDRLQSTLLRVKIYDQFRVISDEESPEIEIDSIPVIHEKISRLSLEELIADAGIQVRGGTGEDLYRRIEAYIDKYSFTGDEIDNAGKIILYIKTFAYQFIDSTIKSGNIQKDDWHKLASYIWGRVDNQLGGVEKIQSVVDACSDKEMHLLENFLSAIRNTADFNEWEDNVHDAYFELKKAVLLKAPTGIDLDPEWNIHHLEGVDSTYYSDLLNSRVVALWKLSEWAIEGRGCIQYLRSERGDNTYASWCHPEGDPAGDRKEESCYYLIDSDGVAVVREFNECLNLTNEQDLHAAAMTILKDVMGGYDMDRLSSSFYSIVSSKRAPSQEFIQGSITREQLIDAMVNEWIVNCYCAPDEDDDPPEVKRKEFESMTNEELLESTGCDEIYTIQSFVGQYQQIADEYRQAFDLSVKNAKTATMREKSFLARVMDFLRRLRTKLRQLLNFD